MLSFLIVTFAVLAVAVIAADVRVDEVEDYRSPREAARTLRFVIVSRALCFVALVAAITVLALFEGTLG